MEHVGDRSGCTQVSAVLREGVANLADGAVAVIGGDFYQDRNASWAIALKCDFFVGNARQLARTALDGALDVISRHVFGLRCSYCGTQARVFVRIAAALRRHGDFFDHSGENLAPLGVERALLMLNCRPFGMAGHGKTSYTE